MDSINKHYSKMHEIKGKAVEIPGLFLYYIK